MLLFSVLVGGQTTQFGGLAVGLVKLLVVMATVPVPDVALAPLLAPIAPPPPPPEPPPPPPVVVELVVALLVDVALELVDVEPPVVVLPVPADGVRIWPGAGVAASTASRSTMPWRRSMIETSIEADRSDRVEHYSGPRETAPSIW
jgi:hypothetical protein